MEHRKRMMTNTELVDHLKEKGVQFTIIDEKAAAEYLAKNNNYYKLASYRKNYNKYQGGVHDNQYIGLEFAYLKDLAIIDMRLRYILVQMALDIEHYLKLDILNRINDSPTEDGYTICKDYIDSLDIDQFTRLENEINRNSDNIYCGEIIQKYQNDWPVWTFLEVIPFGRLVSFYKYCSDRFDDKNMKTTYYQLLSCKDIRNAAAHSSCILNDLHPSVKKYSPSADVLKAIYKEKILSNTTVQKRMTNIRIQQIVTLFYVHKKIVSSKGIHHQAVELLSELKRRILENIHYYTSNQMILASLEFIVKIIDIWYPNDYDKST